jgi:O-antigen/teichoic acid export membrane protein
MYSFVYIITWILSQFQFIEQANFQFLGIFLSTVIRQGTLFFYVLGSFIFSYAIILPELVYVQMAGAFVGAIVAYVRVRHIVANMSMKLEVDWIAKLFNFGKYSFGTSVSSVIFNSINQAMLGGMISTVATASYNIAVRITNLVEIPTSSVASIVFPQSAKRMELEGKAAVKNLYEKSVAAILAILLPGLILMFIFSEHVVEFVAGERYEESVPILNITLFTCLLIPYGRQFGTLLDSIGKPKITFLNVLLSAVINIVLNYFFIKHMGVIGAAYATLLAGIIGFVISQHILKRELNVSLLNTLIYTKNFYIEFYRKYIRPK